MNGPITLSALAKQTCSVDYCFFISALEGGGAEIVILELVNAIAASGRSVDLLVLEHRGALRDRVPSNTRYITLECNTKKNPLFAYLKYLKIAHPRSVVSNLENPTLLALIASLISKHKHQLFIRIDGNMLWHRKNRRLVDRPLDFLKFFLARLLYPRADRIFAVSEGLNNHLVASLNLRKTQIRTILNPVPRPIVRNYSPEESHSPRILAIGRLVPEKDYPCLLRSLSLVREQIDCTLTILGEGNMREELEHLIIELELEEQVALPGFVNNVGDILASADLFVMSSVSEGLPTALIEALMHGKRIVSTDCDYGPAEILDRGKFGALVPVRDPEAMASQIVRQLKSPILFSEMELNEHLKKFHIGNVASQYLVEMESTIRN